MDHSVKAMEHYVATDQRPLDKCLADVEACDVYVGIFAWRYGFVPDPAQGNPERRSITELEYRRARETGKPCLIYLLDENHPWPPPKMEKGEGGEKLARFRKELGDAHIVSFFKTPDDLAKLVSVSVANLRLDVLVPASSSAPLDSARISISRLPVTGPDLFGREAELKLLDDAWADPNTNVVAFVAWGGVGKTALVNTWLARMAKENFRGAERVYAWSFYSQGTSDERAASADLFIDAALRWFGDSDPTAGSPWDKGERLADLIRRSRTLLTLDGLEPLQYPPGPQEGKLKDQALQALLRELAAQQRGLCVVWTRVKISDLEVYAHGSVRQEDLDTLAPQAGAQILRAQGAKGEDEELEKASAEFGGHSLALTLLSSYLADVCGGDIRRRGEIGSLEEDERHGGHARRVMAAYEKWLGEGPELAVLRLLGLFDRPAQADAIAVLRAAPVIPGLTDALQNLSDNKWRQTLSKLRRIKLLAEPDARVATGSPVAGQTKVRPTDELDAHPLVREHFRQQLQRHHPDAWREANLRLYEHLCATTKELPDTLEEMVPLYAAVAHGCAAGRHHEALEVYWKRIQRENEGFPFRMLGGDIHQIDLAVISNFFESLWNQVVPGLPKWDQAYVFFQAGDGFDNLGFLEEAIPLLENGLNGYLSIPAHTKASHVSLSLCRCYSLKGDLEKSLEYAQKADLYAQKGVNYANRSPWQGNAFLPENQIYFARVTSLVEMAHVLHQMGRLERSWDMFREAEDYQRKFERWPLLYSANGYYYNELLLDQGHYQKVLDRTKKTAKWAHRKGAGLLTMGLENLSIGRAQLLQALKKGRRIPNKSMQHLDEAVVFLKRSGVRDHLVMGLLVRS